MINLVFFDSIGEYNSNAYRIGEISGARADND